MKIKVLVVDPSAAVRRALADIINAAPDMQVVGLASDETQARQAIRDKKPDVMTLEAELPLRKDSDFPADILRGQGLPVVLVSDASARGSKAVLRALGLGAADFVAKPRLTTSGCERAVADELCERLRGAWQASAARQGARDTSPAEANRPTALSPAVLNDKVILIGASTGGTEAIREVLTPLPAEMPPILIVQHMPELFTTSFAKRLDSLSRLHVKEAEDGEPIKPGTAYLAPGHSHLSLKRQGGNLACELSGAQPVNRHRPSVDVLFLSAARMLGPRAFGILLTGMGKDGAQGLLAMRQAGAWTVAQDEDSCVVWGMPREAAMIGGAQEVAPLQNIANLLLQRLRQGERRAA
ncbi:chemotaxis response regulator protein-glutamate methylesterase [Uliginosibacterium sp. H3]|uniref:Protein-glutamate methylesterase/protein-glutamine glutaminase n=1 Tax=Uliginosibacterium silvisoli TaxID=3114758 RepID=A0ABU6K8Z3_9RHOO|nr:chemotaxis response regulator protein-glutamate methylesterase [Uliginosibacterium sp. H3]